MASNNYSNGGGMSSASNEFTPGQGSQPKKPQFFSSSKQGKPADAGLKIERNTQDNATTPVVANQQKAPVNDEKQIYVARQQLTQPDVATKLSPVAVATEDDDEDRTEEILQELKQKAKALSDFVPKDGNFESFPELSAVTVKRMKEKGYVSLFPIQQNCFYPIYNREDIIARDLTGSGKTLGYALPIVEYLRKEKLLGSRKVQAIVMAPTRELALQVTKVFSELKHTPNEYNCITVYGGVSVEEQSRELSRGVDIFVGTTGRIMDHIDRGNINFSNLKTIVLDEADQMLKLGFKEDIEHIIRAVKRQCQRDIQICLFSATIPTWVRQVANYHMKQNCRVVDLAQNLKNKTAKQVQHLAINCPYQNRLSALADVLICYGGQGKTIVFTQTKADANSLILSDKIKQDIEVMHGDIAQNQREVTMKRFKEGKFKVLVATDVASRGLDIPNVDLVIQIEPPKEVETYIHRSGRTARAGASGTCITFYTTKTKFLVDDIERQAGVKLSRVGIPQPADVIKASAQGILTNLKNVSYDVVPYFKDVARQLIDETKGDAETALCLTLAYISGYYKTAFTSRSLITGQEKMITMIMSPASDDVRLNINTCRDQLDRWFNGRLVDNIKVMKSIKNNGGIIFDIYEDMKDRFMDNFDHVQQQENGRLEFLLEKCQELPELMEDESSGQGWRNDGYDNNSSQGGYYGGNRGGRGGYDRGGFDNARGGRGGRGGGYNNDFKQRNDFQNDEEESNTNWRSGGSYDNSNSDTASYRGRGAPSGNRGSRGGQSNSYNDRPQYQNTYQQKDSGFSRGGTSQPSSNQYQQRSGDDSGAAANSSSVFVTNLPSNYSDKDLNDLFKEVNLKPQKAKLLFDQDGKSKCAGFVEFGSSKDAAEAIKQCNNMNMSEGKRLNVQIAKK